MDFERAYQGWRRGQAAAGRPIRRRSSAEGAETYRFAKEVWFPLFGSFAGLHAGYEAIDADGRRRTLQFAWLHAGMRLNVEVGAEEGRIAEERQRDRSLDLAGWDVLRLSAAEVAADAAACRTTVARWLERRIGAGRPMSIAERRREEVVKLARQGRSLVSARDVSEHLRVSDKTARSILRELLARGAFAAAGGGKRRIHRYRLVIPRK